MNLKNIVVDPEVEEAFLKIPLKINDLGYDPWGFNPSVAKFFFTIAKRITNYFRPHIVGIENIPSEGGFLLVANHSGQIPFDALVLSLSALLKTDTPRLVRGMADRWFPSIPFINIMCSRSGVVVGDPINCRNLLEAGSGIMVFPEGTKGSGKPFQERYQFAPFGRGFMRLALQTNTPIIPVGIVGAEESIISIGNAKSIAKLLGIPYMPIPLLLPILGPLSYIPMPTKFHLYFGDPVYFEGSFDDHDTVIQSKVDIVKDMIKNLIDRAIEERKSWF